MTVIIPTKFTPTRFVPHAAAEPTITIDNPVQFLKEKYALGYDSNLMSSGRYKLAGWQWNFRPYLRRFIVNQYGSWQQYYAPNKTLLRKCITGRIDEIVEAK